MIAAPMFYCRFCAAHRDHIAGFCMGCGSDVKDAKDIPPLPLHKIRCPKCTGGDGHAMVQIGVVECRGCNHRHAFVRPHYPFKMPGLQGLDLEARILLEQQRVLNSEWSSLYPKPTPANRKRRKGAPR